MSDVSALVRYVLLCVHNFFGHVELLRAFRTHSLIGENMVVQELQNPVSIQGTQGVDELLIEELVNVEGIFSPESSAYDTVDDSYVGVEPYNGRQPIGGFIIA